MNPLKRKRVEEEASQRTSFWENRLIAFRKLQALLVEKGINAGFSLGKDFKQSNGKILVRGKGNFGKKSEDRAFQIRYNADGTLDESFGDRGVLLGGEINWEEYDIDQRPEIKL